MKNRLCVLLGLLLIIGTANAFEIVGNSVVEDRNNFSLTVTPHTFSSPTGPFVQEFVLKNKTNTNFYNDVFVNYLFENPLRSFKVELWKPPIYAWVPRTGSCPVGANVFYELNRFEGEHNNHYGECWEVKNCSLEAFQARECHDLLEDYNSFFFKTGFHSYSIERREIYFDENKLVAGRNWEDKTSVFLEREQNGSNYHNSVPASIMSNQEKKWRITYLPDFESDLKKWDLTMYSGESASCLFDGNCSVSVTLDPWFDNDFACKYRVDLNTSIISSDVNNLPILYNFNPSAREIAGCSFQEDGSDFRPISSDETLQLKYYFEGTWTSTDVNAWILLNDYNGMLNDDNFFVYFGNASALDANDSTEVYSTTDFNASYDFDQTTGNYVDRTSNSINVDVNSVTSRDGNAFIGKNVPRLDGANDFMTLPSNIITSIGTFSVWVKHNGTFGSFEDVLTGIPGAETYPLLFASGKPNNYTCGLLADNAIDNNWHWVISLVDGTTARLYVDGVEVKSGACSSTMRINTIGKRSANLSEFWDGHLDEISIWSRVLSPDEIMVLYKNQAKDGFILGTGATQINNSAPDLNVVYPENNESFNKDLNSTIDINFFIIDTDDNTPAYLFDLNYSSSQTEGTGTVILDDANLSTAFSCSGTNLVAGQYCKYAWDISGVSNGDYYLLGKAIATNSDFNAGENTFTITSGPSCGDTITENTTLTQNLTGCTENGISIGANNITLDCDGYGIFSAFPAGSYGVFNSDFDGVTIQNCDINGFYDQIYVTGGTLDLNINNNLLTHGSSSGAYVYNDANNFSVEDNNFSYNVVGLNVRESDGGNAFNNTFLDNTFGIYVSLGANDNNFTNNTINSGVTDSEGITSSSATSISYNNYFFDTNISTDGNHVVVKSDDGNVFLVNVEHDTEETTLTTTTIFNGWWLDVQVLDDSDESAISGADVNITDTTGKIWHNNLQTDGSGNIATQWVFDYNKNLDGTQSYSPYDINVSATSYDSNSTRQTIDQNKEIIIRLTSIAPVEDTCTNNGINLDWVVNQECNYFNTIIDIGTGTLNITKNGIIGLDNSIIKAQKFNYEPGNIGIKIRRTNGGNTILNK